jgi:hypothetical protein
MLDCQNRYKICCLKVVGTVFWAAVDTGYIAAQLR